MIPCYFKNVQKVMKVKKKEKYKKVVLENGDHEIGRDG
jgi:hypothetical protein